MKYFELSDFRLSRLTCSFLIMLVVLPIYVQWIYLQTYTLFLSKGNKFCNSAVDFFPYSFFFIFFWYLNPFLKSNILSLRVDLCMMAGKNLQVISLGSYYICVHCTFKAVLKATSFKQYLSWNVSFTHSNNNKPVLCKHLSIPQLFANSHRHER